MHEVSCIDVRNLDAKYTVPKYLSTEHFEAMQADHILKDPPSLSKTNQETNRAPWQKTNTRKLPPSQQRPLQDITSALWFAFLVSINICLKCPVKSIGNTLVEADSQIDRNEVDCMSSRY